MSRTFAHTLAFALLITLIGFYLYRRRGGLGMLALSFGNLVHLALDKIWWRPSVLLWPLYGANFIRGHINWPEILVKAVRDPWILGGEILGLVIIVWFGLRLAQRGGIRAFIRTGA